MTGTSASAQAESRLTGLVSAALRGWRRARDEGQPRQQALYAVLVKSDQGLLAPVFDSLLTFAEAVLGRPLLAGNREEPSSDEVLIARMIAGTSAWRKSLRCTQCQAALFDCALCSIRHVIAQIDLMPTYVEFASLRGFPGGEKSESMALGKATLPPR